MLAAPGSALVLVEKAILLQLPYDCSVWWPLFSGTTRRQQLQMMCSWENDPILYHHDGHICLIMILLYVLFLVWSQILFVLAWPYPVRARLRSAAWVTSKFLDLYLYSRIRNDYTLMMIVIWFRTPENNPMIISEATAMIRRRITHLWTTSNHSNARIQLRSNARIQLHSNSCFQLHNTNENPEVRRQWVEIPVVIKQ